MHSRLALAGIAISITCVGATATPYGIGCATDVTNDGQVDVSDVLAEVQAWGSNDPALDIDGDGVVAVGDILMIFTEWGTDCGSIHPFRQNMMVYIIKLSKSFGVLTIC